MAGPNTRLQVRVSPGVTQPGASLEILAGHGGPDKVVSIAGISRAETERRLAGAVAATS